MRQFLLGRIQLVHHLMSSKTIDIEYHDIALILCSVMSAAATAQWRGSSQGQDKKRFVELLINHTTPDFRTDNVSVPILLNTGHVDRSTTHYGQTEFAARILTDSEVDISINAARLAFPSVANRVLKKHTYAALIYTLLRCGYAHSYYYKEDVTHVRPSRRSARTSYIDRGTTGEPTRIICFHLPYLLELATFVADNVPPNAACPPNKWWIDSE